MKLKQAVVVSLFSVAAFSAMGESYDLNYKARSGIMQLGSSSIHIDAGADAYNIRMERNLSWPGIIKEQSSTAVSGSLSGVNTHPQNYVQTRTGKELTRTTKVKWSGGVPSVTMDPPIETRSETVLDLATAKNSIDPLSTIYRVMRDVSANGGCTGSFTSFDGFSSITTTLQPLGVQAVSTPIFEGDAVGCRVQMIGKSGLIMGGKRATEATNMDIFLANVNGSQMVVPVLIQSKEGAKSVSLKLVDFYQ